MNKKCSIPSAAAPKEIGLERDAVAVAPGHLDDRLESGLADDDRRGYRGHRRDRAIAVSDVHRVDKTLEHTRAPAHDARRGGLGWIELGRDDELATTKKLLVKVPLIVGRTASLIFPLIGPEVAPSGTPPVAEASSGRSLSLSG